MCIWRIFFNSCLFLINKWFDYILILMENWKWELINLKCDKICWKGIFKDYYI